MPARPPAATDQARALLNDVLSRPAYALISFAGEADIALLGGTPVAHDRVADIPLESGPPAPGRRFDRLVCVPFAQIRERGFEVHDDGTPLTSIDIAAEFHLDRAELIAQLPDEPLVPVGAHGFDVADSSYAETVQRILTDEIGNGEGANLVVNRSYRAVIADWDTAKALTVYRRLLEHERGAYWTFLVFTGVRYLIGASPERHVSVQGGDVRMNPISGTFRLSGSGNPQAQRAQLLDFLADEKEIYELFMVVDEELKMMCDICSEGGQVLGPFLKPMSQLVHTEYVLAGRTRRDIRDVLRDSMFAATVTGSPVENACRLIKRYEPAGRGYYGAVLALFGRSPDGAATLDAPIVLRTAEVGVDGALRVAAGATLVRDSDPAHEVAETHAKAAAVLTAFGLVLSPPTGSDAVAKLATDDQVLAALQRRNDRLSRFWFNDQSTADRSADLAGREVVVLDGEDAFVSMLRHILGSLGATSRTVRHRDYRPGVFTGADLVVVGPGPGDPRDLSDPKIAAVRAAVEDLLAAGTPFLAVCLGHQVLCGLLGLRLVYKDIVFQGTQNRLEVLGQPETVGFYNTFVARVDAATTLPPGVSVESDAAGDVHLLAGPGFRGVQFHAESILTQHGDDIVRRLALAAMSSALEPTRPVSPTRAAP